MIMGDAARLSLDLREGRSEKAARLHSVARASRQEKAARKKDAAIDYCQGKPAAQDPLREDNKGDGSGFTSF